MERVSEPQVVERALGRDFMSSLVVFLVALPLCMGISIASGAPVAAGLVTGIIGGIVVGMLAGAPLQVSGPAAGLTVICAEIIGEHGLPAFAVVVLIAGGLQFVAGMCYVGQWFRAVSPAVVHGMLSGIGILILSSQLHVMVDDKPQKSGIANIRTLPEAFEKGLPLPKQEATESKQARVALLKEFGQLHERQAEIAAHVARHALPADHRATTDKSRAKELTPFVSQQQAVLAELGTLREELEAAPLERQGDEDGAKLTSSVQQARRSLEAALSDLEAGAADKAAASQAQATASLGEVLASLKSHDWAAKIGFITIAVIILWQMLAPSRLKIIPGPLLAITVVTLLAWAGSLPVLYVEVPDRLIDGLTFPSLHVFTDVPIWTLLLAGFSVAVIASAETLLCATAVDRMHTGPRTNYDRELTAQGVGNMLCGLCGALPMTGVIVRSATNVHAGAKSRMSAILHGVWLLVFVLLFGALLRMIPTAALAGILVYTGFRLIDFHGFRKLWREDRADAIIFLTTVALIVVEDLLIGVVAGLVLSALKLLWTFSYLDVRTISSRDGACTIRLSGVATFLRLPVLAKRLEEVPPGVEATVDIERLTYIDQACMDLILSWARQREAAGERTILDRPRLESLRHGAKRGATLETLPKERPAKTFAA